MCSIFRVHLHTTEHDLRDAARRSSQGQEQSENVTRGRHLVPIPEIPTTVDVLGTNKPEIRPVEGEGRLLCSVVMIPY